MTPRGEEDLVQGVHCDGVHCIEDGEKEDLVLREGVIHLKSHNLAALSFSRHNSVLLLLRLSMPRGSP